jgi:hypothetical protein
VAVAAGVSTTGTAPRRAEQNWLWSILPAFPVVLLVLRLWYLSRQDLPTMLLLVQYVSPLGLLSALIITLLWTAPAVVLVLRALGGLLLASARTPAEAGRSLLALTASRMPDWVVVLAGVLAGITWQLRFLPTLLMLLLAILGLTAWQRHADDRAVLVVVTLAAPAAAGLLCLLWTWPGIVAGARHGEATTVLLLAAPALLAPALTGPVPPWAVRLATHWPAAAAALVSPFVVGAMFLRAPILPAAAVEVGRPGGPVDVVRGHVITVNDTTTTVLDRGGEVRFVPNGDVRSQTLCAEPAQAPESAVTIRGWAVEDSVLEWVAPTRRVDADDPRCLGRPLMPGPATDPPSAAAAARANQH